jgi:hypothetical protein
MDNRAAENLIIAMGMFSENLQRLHRGESIAYAENSFTELAIEIRSQP